MPPRFVDASVFVHAYLRPRRPLKPHERAIKNKAQAIVTRINEGEKVVISIVHLIEVANVLEDWMPLADARAVQLGLCSRDNIEIVEPTRRDLIDALSLGSEVELGTSDALAAVLMRQRHLTEIYSFDRDLDRFEDLQRVSH